MLAARSSNAFVCVRCELRLLRSSPSSLSRHPLRAQFSSSPARRGDALDEIERPAPEEQSQPRRKVSAHPLGRLHRHRGRATVRASTAQLEGVKTLGKDAEILVLREVGDRQDQSEKRQPDVVETPDDVDSPDILESIQGEGGPSTPQEVDEQLDSLRPKTYDDADKPHYITIEAYQSLTRTLNKSFTAQQLAHYLTPAKGSGGRPSKKQLVNQVLPAGKGKRPVERTPWFPGVTSSHRRLPGTDAHPDTKKNKSKPLMIDHILRTKWKVVTLEEIESTGEIEMRMNPWQLDLLTAGDSSSALDRVGNLRKAKIQAFETNQVLRITAAKSSAEYAADDIERLLKSTKTLTLRVDQWLESIPEESIPKDILEAVRKGDAKARLVDMIPKRGIREIGLSTGTAIQEVANHTVKIRGFDDASVQEAQRYLIGLLPRKSTATWTLDTQRLDARTDEMQLLPLVFKDGLPYQNRSQDLGRWTCDSAKLQAPESNSQKSAMSHRESIVNALRSIIRVQEPEIRSPVQIRHTRASWEQEADQLEAVFGHVLFPAKVSSTTTPLDDSRSASGLFSYDLPAVTKFLVQDARTKRHASIYPILHYDFTPAPIQQHESSNEYCYPTLSFRFRVHPSPHLQDVALKFGEHIIDVPLPDQATDLRFKHAQKLRMVNSHQNPYIQAFVDAVLANIESGQKLTAPPSLAIDIPKWTIPGWKTGFSHSETLNVKYLLADIAHRQSYLSKFAGQSVAYHVLQRGKLGGKGSNLSTYRDSLERRARMETLSSQEDREKALKEIMHDFVGTTFGIAERITAMTALTYSTSSACPTGTRHHRQEAREGEHNQDELPNNLSLANDRSDHVPLIDDYEPENSNSENEFNEAGAVQEMNASSKEVQAANSLGSADSVSEESIQASHAESHLGTADGHSASEETTNRRDQDALA